MYSVLPDYLGLINLSLWDRMHQKERLVRLLQQQETNDACAAMLHHLEVDDVIEGHIHKEHGALRSLRRTIEEDIHNVFRVKGKFAEELAEFIIEISLDQILVEKENFMPIFKRSVENLDVETTAEKLKQVMEKSKRKIMKYLNELKRINPDNIITVDGVLEIARHRYGINFKSFIELSKKIQLHSIGGALKNVSLVIKLMRDKVYIDKFKEMQQKYKREVEKKFDFLVKEVKNAHFTTA